jgi:hypothetical protein
MVICVFKKSLTIPRVLAKRNNLQAVKVENRYFFRKCKSNPKIVETAVLSYCHKYRSTYSFQIMLMNETRNTNRGNRRLWTTRHCTWIGESSTMTNLVISISFFAVASMVWKQKNQWNTMNNLISTFQGRVCIFWLRSWLVIARPIWLRWGTRRMGSAVKGPTILNGWSKNRRDYLYGNFMEPIHFLPTESQDRDMSSIKWRLEEERSVSFLINKISRESANKHLWEQRMSCCINKYWV